MKELERPERTRMFFDNIETEKCTQINDRLNDKAKPIPDKTAFDRFQFSKGIVNFSFANWNKLEFLIFFF